MAESKETTQSEIHEGTDGEPAEVLRETWAPVDLGDAELDLGHSPEPSEHGEDDDFNAGVSFIMPVSVKETEQEQMERKTPRAAGKSGDGREEQERETEAEVISSPISPLDSSPSEDSSSAMDCVSTVLSLNGRKPGRTSLCEKEDTGINDKEGDEGTSERDIVEDQREENSLDAMKSAVSEETNVDMTSYSNVEPTDSSITDRKMDVDSNEDTKTNEESEGDGNSGNSVEMPETTGAAKQQKTLGSDAEKDSSANVKPLSCKFIDTIASDLDEIMDIGTVDQFEQEAQMKEEEQKNIFDADSSNSSAPFSNTDDRRSPEETDTDEKPSVLPPPEDDDQSEDKKVPVDLLRHSSSPSSEATASRGRNISSAAAMMNGMKVVKVSLPKLDHEKLQLPTLTSSSSAKVKSSPSPPLVKVKDEPLDEEYDRALISSASTASIKDEPNTPKDDLQIGSVFSVTGHSGSSTELQSLPTLSSSALHMVCSHCKKNLMKGQTAYQRKGSPALFCSTACLSATLTVIKPVTKICHYCLKTIMRPQDVILAPVDVKGTMKDFCSQTCLSAFNFKRNVSTKIPLQAIVSQSLCSMCSRYCISKHEVILNSTVHKICSDACFVRFRAVNNLSMASCGNCGSYCHNKPIMLKLEDSSKTFCNAECLAKFKEKVKTPQPCTMCRSSRVMSEMVENKNSDDVMDLFCSSSCVMAYKVQTVSTSGASLTCDSCGKTTVPAYHLAMSDTSIRNFCTLPCVMAFQEKFKSSQKQLNVFTKMPVPSTQTQTQTATPNLTPSEVPKGLAKLPCFQCYRLISSKPELIQIKDELVFVCSLACSQEYKKVNNVTGLCEYCKIERVPRDTKRIDNKDCHFCSDGCKLLYKHDLVKSWGKHCRCCAYCFSTSKKLVMGQYGGTTEEFCSDDCRSKYTMLFCHVAKCDTCGRKKKLMQTLPMLGEVKHFCDVTCLLQFCSSKTFSQGQVVNKGTVEATPVIANVISLASTPIGQPNASASTAQTGAVPNVPKKKLGHASTQTDAVKMSAPPPKVLKNKALLCRPLVQNKGVACKTQTVDTDSQTDDLFPKVIVLPVPVPVFVPVPMSMYSQYTPKPVGLPLPLPVPMFLPVTLDSAERIVETIQEIKQKIPSDPFEAELILMAEMVAEDESGEKKSRKDRVVEKERNRPESQAPEDQTSNYSDDLDTDDLASFLNNWDEPSSDTSHRSPSRPYINEKLHPLLDIPVGMPSEPYSEPPPPAPPPMDIEADFTIETLEKMAQLRAQPQRSPSPPPAPPLRRQAHRKARDKNKGRKSQRLAKAETASQKGRSKKGASKDPPKLKTQYGIDAWKRWIQWRETQPNLEKPRFGSRLMELKEDVLHCTTAELSYGLCRFIAEVKRPNGEAYSPDSLFYLCLGIQKHLFENGRVENIFTDIFYSKFSMEFTRMLKEFKPSITATGYIHSRVEEEYLWDCKQLGAYSPIVLLNTLLFFCCKFFGFTTVEQHRQLSFAHVMRCTKTSANNTKTTFLRFYPPLSVNEPDAKSPPGTPADADEVPAKKRREEENKEEILEMMENSDNPLRCPVRLYEFYLSKCSESVKQRTNLFYLHPERSCVPNSPLWFSSTPLDDHTMEAMLIRILTVRELHLKPEKEGGKGRGQEKNDPLYLPDEEEDSE
ncbi:zinc finger MYM-type protein 4 isoform X2 [Myripristis murdjan]|uniref:Zinc finger MYM-type containing 4, tandem duplicate 1 n=1 Tax=Myripristis murdjan TaxID=586833 RepID=A0A667YQD9_9TELE|nr:zinc finger MYM-type protein 4-like isoform X2 [Myripristis murdjan]